jgi:hypothetical protein
MLSETTMQQLNRIVHLICLRGALMIQFVCDSCGAVKEASDVWVLGLAAEALGAASARREVTILSTWDRPSAVYPLAVHFCSLECKDDYVGRLFTPVAIPNATLVKRTYPGEKVAVLRDVQPLRRRAVQPRRSRRKKTA